jgi:hypothetical protein
LKTQDCIKNEPKTNRNEPKNEPGHVVENKREAKKESETLEGLSASESCLVAGHHCSGSGSDVTLQRVLQGLAHLNRFRNFSSSPKMPFWSRKPRTDRRGLTTHSNSITRYNEFAVLV